MRRSLIRSPRSAPCSDRMWGPLPKRTTGTAAVGTKAFLVLRVVGAGARDQWVPLTLVVMSVAYAVTASRPATGRTPPPVRALMSGLLTLLIAHILLATTGRVSTVLAGVAGWGVNMGLTRALCPRSSRIGRRQHFAVPLWGCTPRPTGSRCWSSARAAVYSGREEGPVHPSGSVQRRRWPRCFSYAGSPDQTRIKVRARRNKVNGKNSHPSRTPRSCGPPALLRATTDIAHHRSR
jgi:hypothetical protein